MAAPHQHAPSTAARSIPELVLVDAGLFRAPWRSVADGVLRRIDRVLDSGRRVVPLATLERALGPGPNPPDAVVLGLVDIGPEFVQRAWPSFLERGLAPTIFVHTACVGQRPLGRNFTEGRTLSWLELRQLLDDGADVESAGHLGLRPRASAPEVLFGDLVRSYRELEHRLGRAPRALLMERSSGKGRVRDLVRRAGFGLAFHDRARPPYVSAWGLGSVGWSRWSAGGGLPWLRPAAPATILGELPPDGA